MVRITVIVEIPVIPPLGTHGLPIELVDQLLQATHIGLDQLLIESRLLQLVSGAGLPVAVAGREFGLQENVTDLQCIDSIEEQIVRAMSTRVTLENLILGMFSGHKTLRLENSGISVLADNGENIGLASLSSGEKQVLRIFIDVLEADMHALMIDEPEISLHVDWQKVLVRSMRLLNPDAQLILATHSPEVIADLEDDTIFKL